MRFACSNCVGNYRDESSITQCLEMSGLLQSTVESVGGKPKQKDSLLVRCCRGDVLDHAWGCMPAIMHVGIPQLEAGSQILIIKNPPVLNPPEYRYCPYAGLASWFRCRPNSTLVCRPMLSPLCARANSINPSSRYCLC